MNTDVLNLRYKGRDLVLNLEKLFLYERLALEELIGILYPLDADVPTAISALNECNILKKLNVISINQDYINKSAIDISFSLDENFYFTFIFYKSEEEGRGYYHKNIGYLSIKDNIVSPSELSSVVMTYHLYDNKDFVIIF